jgi:hypothetical protein
MKEVRGSFILMKNKIGEFDSSLYDRGRFCIDIVINRI